MPLKPFRYHKALLNLNLRQTGWLAIVNFLVLLFSVPLQIFFAWEHRQAIGRSPSDFAHYHNLFSEYFDVQFVLMIGFPVLLSMVLFRYLHHRTACDFFHSLPIRRGTLYAHFTTIGVAYILLPLLLNGAILLLMRTALSEMNFFYRYKDVGYWVTVTGTFELLIFAAGVFVAFLTGMSSAQAVLTYILLLFPTGIMGLIFVNLRFFLFGLLPDYYNENTLMSLSPLTDAALNLAYDTNTLQWEKIIVYLAFGMLFLSLSLWLYKKRPLEAVSQAIIFRQLRPIFKYGVTFCSMLLGGAYFGSVGNNLVWVFIGYLTGSLIGYFIAEMVLQKSWRVFTHIKGYLWFAAAATILILLAQADITGFQHRVPDLKDIKRVYFSSNSFAYLQKLKANAPYIADGLFPYAEPYLYESKNIETIRELHKEIIKNKSKLTNKDIYSETVFIAYELKNGHRVIREYHLPDGNPYAAYLRRIYNSKEYKETEFGVLNIRPEQVAEIKITPNDSDVKKGLITEADQIHDALEALKEDIMKVEVVPNTIYNSDAMITVQLKTGKNKQFDMPFNDNYSRFERVLQEYGLLDK